MSDVEKFLATLTRLEKLLEEKDRRIRELEREKEENELQENWSWTIHSKAEESDLPVPRLELRWEESDESGYNWVAKYSLIYRHLLGYLEMVPLGYTRRGGGHSPLNQDGTVDTPLRDGAHIGCDSYTLKLPAFAIYGNVVTRIEPRPPPRWEIKK